MSSSVPYDPYIPGGEANAPGGNHKTAAIQAVSMIRGTFDDGGNDISGGRITWIMGKVELSRYLGVFKC